MDRVKELLQDKAAHDKLCRIFPKAVKEFDLSCLGLEGVKGYAFSPTLMLEELATNVPPTSGDYVFYWPGKRKAWLLGHMHSQKALIPVPEKSVGKKGEPGGFDSENIYIEGDNLEALSLLRKNYTGKIKLIYIDPPYNTGQKFVYNDYFKTQMEDYTRLVEEERHRC